MCLQLHYNGLDNKGRDISLWLVVMQNEFDSCLEWPLDADIQLMILSQKRKETKDHVRTFHSDLKNTAFQKPVKERNQRYGYKKFYPLNELREKDFLSDGSLYIKATVTPKEFDGPVAGHPSHQEPDSSDNNIPGNIDSHNKDTENSQAQTDQTHDDTITKDLTPMLEKEGNYSAPSKGRLS